MVAFGKHGIGVDRGTAGKKIRQTGDQQGAGAEIVLQNRDDE